ncbi:DUF2764 family protein [bacterium]|nr:DUF2764 family protein [bacterium]
MSNYYTLVCSLPYLNFEGEPPMSPEEFIERATPWLSEAELKALTDPDPETGVAAEWALFERSFRSAVAQVRAAKLGKEFQPDRLKTDVMDGAVRQGIAELYKTGEPLKIERGLDLICFSRLDEMSAGHFFDYTVVFCYYKKLTILWRWKCLDDLKGQEVLKNSCMVKN